MSLKMMDKFWTNSRHKKLTQKFGQILDKFWTKFWTSRKCPENVLKNNGQILDIQKCPENV
jgi:hypothetical protein